MLDIEATYPRAGSETLLTELQKRKDLVYDYLASDDYIKRFAPKHIADGAYSYIKRGGKSLRPAALLLSCGATGGREADALPAAASVEVYHTWTLAHDDIIDQDDQRRGAPTLHVEFARRAVTELGYSKEKADRYGFSIGMLVGDLQQGWSVSLLTELHSKRGIDPSLVLYLINELLMNVQLTLIEGETLDIQFEDREVESLTEEQIVDMLWKKTGVLYEFAGKAGAMIGVRTASENHPLVWSLAKFCGLCGTAFQLQDDILGIVGDQGQLGKPIGSDIREGKRTLILYTAYKNASPAERKLLTHIVGNKDASNADIHEATQLLYKLGGIEHTYKTATRFVENAMNYLKPVPDSSYKALLVEWASYLVERRF